MKKSSVIGGIGGDISTNNKTKYVVMGLTGVVILGLSGLVLWNMQDAMFGKKVKKVVRAGLLSQGATYSRGMYSGGPINPGLSLSETEVVAGIVGDYMETIRMVNQRQNPQPQNQPTSTPDYEEDSDIDTSGIPTEMLQKSRSPVLSSHSSARPRNAAAASGPINTVKDDIPEEASFASFTTKKTKFDPEDLLRRYEKPDEAARRVRNTMTARSSGSNNNNNNNDDDDGGDSESDGEEDTSESDGAGGYIDDISAQKRGKPPKFPEEPINTNVRDMGSGDYEDPDNGRRKKTKADPSKANNGRAGRRKGGDPTYAVNNLPPHVARVSNHSSNKNKNNKNIVSIPDEYVFDENIDKNANFTYNPDANL